MALEAAEGFERLVTSGRLTELEGARLQGLRRRARALGISFVASVDAHATSQLGYLDNAITLARRAAVRREQVLNTLDGDAFAATVRPLS